MDPTRVWEEWKKEEKGEEMNQREEREARRDEGDEGEARKTGKPPLTTTTTGAHRRTADAIDEDDNDNNDNIVVIVATAPRLLPVDAPPNRIPAPTKHTGKCPPPPSTRGHSEWWRRRHRCRHHCRRHSARLQSTSLPLAYTPGATDYRRLLHHPITSQHLPSTPVGAHCLFYLEATANDDDDVGSATTVRPPLRTPSDLTSYPLVYTWRRSATPLSARHFMPQCPSSLFPSHLTSIRPARPLF